MPDPVLDQVLGTLRGSMECSIITLGARLGCWAALGERPLTADELAHRVSIHSRYAREWLEAMTAAGLLTVDDGTFTLADGVADVLVDEASDTYLAPLLRQASGAASSLRSLEQTYRAGGGLAWSAQDPDVAEQQGPATRGQLQRHLPGWLRRGLPDVVDRLARVADVGCGHGWASIGLAQAFPDVRIDAYDVDPASVAVARSNVETAGLTERISVHDRELEAVAAYDLVLLAGMLHDVPDPVGLLTAARVALAADGVVLVVDMKVADELTSPAADVDRLMYGFSTLICLPDSMSFTPTAATGTVMRRATLHRYAEEAGFGTVQELPIKHQTSRFYALTP